MDRGGVWERECGEKEERDEDNVTGRLMGGNLTEYLPLTRRRPFTYTLIALAAE